MRKFALLTAALFSGGTVTSGQNFAADAPANGAVATTTPAPALLAPASPAGRPIKLGEAPVVMRKTRDHLIDVLRRGGLEVYRSKGRRDPKWDAAAERLLDSFATWYVNQIYKDDRFLKSEIPSDQGIVAEGRLALEAGCDDPAFLAALSAILARSDPSEFTRNMASRAAELLSDTPYDGVYRAIALRAARQNFGDASDDQMLALIIKLAAKPDVDSAQVTLYRSVWYADQEVRTAEERRQFIDRARAGGADQWFIEQELANTLRKEAWDSRGGAPAAAVDQNRFETFFKLLDESGAHYSAAVKLRPDMPASAVGLLSVRFAQQAEASEVRDEFDRCTAIAFDYLGAYQAYRQRLLPRWGGSVEEMYDFGRACAATKRFDTGVPWQFVELCRSISSEPDCDPAILQKPEVIDEIANVVRGYDAQAKANGKDAEWAWRELRLWAKYLKRDDLVAIANAEIHTPDLSTEIAEKLQPALKGKDFANATAVLDELIVRFPTSESELQQTKFKVAIAGNDGVLAGRTARRIALLNPLGCGLKYDMAAKIVEAKRLNHPDLDTALYLATDAVSMTMEREPLMLETLARVHFARGDVPAAIAWQQKAVALAADDEKIDMQKTLDAFRSPESQQGSASPSTQSGGSK